MKILILYASLEGQSALIAQRIGESLRAHGHRIITQRLTTHAIELEPELFEAVVLGGSIHMGRYPRYLKQFVSQNRAWLDSVPTAFFTVCMAINSQQAESRQIAASYGEKFFQQNNWHPALSATFAGAVKYTQYNFITRLIMKRISKREGGSTDTSNDHEYTDWDAVTRFAREFAEKLTVFQQA